MTPADRLLRDLARFFSAPPGDGECVDWDRRQPEAEALLERLKRWARDEERRSRAN